jgi:hypothetical protein
MEHLEIPRGPPGVGIVWSDPAPFGLLAILPILHLRIIYHRYLTPLIAHNICPIQDDLLIIFCCFFLFIISKCPTKGLANIMFGVASRE